jgi:hypothetical protein
MTCPKKSELDLLAMEAFDGERQARLLGHLRECLECQRAYEGARRGHLDRIRMYDQLDRDHDELREQLMAVLPVEPTRSRADRFVRGWRRMGGFAMSINRRLGGRATIGLLSAAACIGIAVLVMTFAQGKNAFATAIEQLQKAKTIVCRVSTATSVSATPMPFRQTGKIYFSAEYGSRCELSMNGAPMIIQYAPPQGPITTVTPLTRTYTVVEQQAAGQPGQPGNAPDSFIHALMKLKGEASRELGRKNLDGVEALGYEISGQLLGLGQGEGVRSELWIDSQTYLPVRYVAEMAMPEVPGTGFKGGTCQMVYDQFEWDTPVDPKLFAPDIPADYTRVDATMPTPDEGALIQGLSNYAELTGKYPTALSASTMVTEFSSALGARIASAMFQGKKAPDQKELMQKSLEIGAGIAFYQKLAAEGHSPEYYGKTVKPGQADAVLVRWKLPDGQWRVIYGDLRTVTMPADGN